MRNALLYAAAAALIVPVTAAIAQGWPDIAGRWETTYGPLDFTVTDIKDDKGVVIGKAATAPYKTEGGTVSGTLKGRHWSAIGTNPIRR